MSQNGQGNDPHLPAARPAQEGVVLPSSGSRPGEPAPGGSWAPDGQATPAAGAPWGQPWGPDTAAAAPGPGPQQGQAWGDAQQQYPAVSANDANPQDSGHGLPPAQARPPQAGALPPGAPPPPPQPPAAPPQPPAGASDETQMLPPQQPYAQSSSPFDAPSGSGGASWPQPEPDAEATRFMPPASGGPGASGVSGGAPLPPEAPSESAAERTAFLGQRPPQPGGDPDATQVMGVRMPPPAGPAGPAGGPGGPGAPSGRAMPSASGQEPPRPSAAPFGIRPGMPGDRPPPAEFDGLFRHDAGQDAGQGADRTRTMPPVSGQHPPYGAQGAAPRPYPQQSRAERRGAERAGLSTAAIIGIVVAACAVVGLAAGAALSSGDETDDGKKPVASSPEAPKADPAEQQAKKLDALLADSNNSRSAVINAVASIKTCTNLQAAASDLRAAAKQRTGLVTRLAKTPVDSLPRHTELTRHLNDAWKASASADLHYANWADQVAGKKGCHKGKARSTRHTAAGNRASGEATNAKKQAAALWNAIAREHGLTEREYGQL